MSGSFSKPGALSGEAWYEYSMTTAKKSWPKPAWQTADRWFSGALLVSALTLASGIAAAQGTTDPEPWGADVTVKPLTRPPTVTAPIETPPAVPQPPAGSSNTTVIERVGAEPKPAAPGVKLVALLTADGQQIDQGIVWRVFQGADVQGKAKLIVEKREPSPQIKLQPGDYTINAAFGRAHLTRKISVAPDTANVEQFVLNAGGLRVNALTGGKPAPPGTVSYTIFSDDRDQFANRTALLSGAKPNLIMRLNAGIYRIVSTFGDGNARVETDVTVEAGKLTETTISHAAGRAMLKLVTRAGGEALPDTSWTIMSASGEVVKETVGALPRHYLAPGTYLVAARSAGQVYKSSFTIQDGANTEVEVLMDANAAAAVTEAVPEPGIAPSAEQPLATETETNDLLDLKNP